MLPATGDEGRKGADHLQSLSSVSRPRCVAELCPWEAARRHGQRSTHSRAFRQGKGSPSFRLPAGPASLRDLTAVSRHALRPHRGATRCFAASERLSENPGIAIHVHPHGRPRVPAEQPGPTSRSCRGGSAGRTLTGLGSPTVRRGVGRRPAASDDGGNKDACRQSQNHQISENGRKETKARRKTTAGHAAYCSKKRLPREGGQPGANHKQRVGKE